MRAPWQFFWATGILSSFLDNAPTYLTFLALGQGLGLAREVVGVPHAILAAGTLTEAGIAATRGRLLRAGFSDVTVLGSPTLDKAGRTAAAA